MLVNVYNKSGISITIDNTIIEEGVNSIPAIQWNAISRNKSILDLIKNCDLFCSLSGAQFISRMTASFMQA